MALVHNFAIEPTLFGDTGFPIQQRGGSRPPAARNVALLTLAEWLIANTAPNFSVVANVSASTHTQGVPMGKWCVAFAVSSAFDQTINVGTTLGGDNIALGMFIAAGTTETTSVILYGGTGGVNLYFSGLVGSSTITFLVI